ncbi:hypothetical protein J5N97_011675 [Dioscorea zingiberensis]|uniref:Uncharacterized protein n=1 Tax=Dioscorea zingiberensis TaxID=325984 RepID=A0A9D5D0S6_9LILI|nr:hypothetical protein J5N97_011675 [Dioscorea zingiberensis]
MASFENSNWAFDPSIIGDIHVPVVDFGAGDGGYYWTPQGLNVSSNASLQVDGSHVTSDGPKESSSCKRARSETSGAPSSKACREKMRRDRLNDKFLELDSNEKLQEKIKELKTEKNELRDEKQRLKAEKENLEQQIKLLNARPSFVPHPPVIPTAYAAQGQAAGQKLMMPVIGYPGFPMWQFMPPADVDTSQDVESCPPVA